MEDHEIRRSNEVQFLFMKEERDYYILQNVLNLIPWYIVI